jgi:hypothetical protein
LAILNCELKNNHLEFYYNEYWFISRHLSDNQLTGDIHSSIGNLVSLKSLKLASREFFRSVRISKKPKSHFIFQINVILTWKNKKITKFDKNQVLPLLSFSISIFIASVTLLSNHYLIYSKFPCKMNMFIALEVLKQNWLSFLCPNLLRSVFVSKMQK